MTVPPTAKLPCSRITSGSDFLLLSCAPAGVRIAATNKARAPILILLIRHWSFFILLPYFRFFSKNPIVSRPPGSQIAACRRSLRALHHERQEALLDLSLCGKRFGYKNAVSLFPCDQQNRARRNHNPCGPRDKTATVPDRL